MSVMNWEYEGRTLTSNGYQNLYIQVKDGIVTDVSKCSGDKGTLLTRRTNGWHQHWRDWNQTIRGTAETESLHALMTGNRNAELMPNTSPGLTNYVNLKTYIDVFMRGSCIPIKVLGAFTPKSKKEELLRMGLLNGFQYKAFMAESIGNDHFSNVKTYKRVVINELPTSDDIRKFLERPENGEAYYFFNSCNPNNVELRAGLSVHFEHPARLKELAHLWDPLKPVTHYDARPNIVEYEAFEFHVEQVMPEIDAITIARHVSAGETMDLASKIDPRDLMIEVCLAYLIFTKEDYEKRAQICLNSAYDTKVNPSFKTIKDLEELIKGINSSLVKIIGTDHAPHYFKDKYEKYFSGMPSYSCGCIGNLLNEDKIDPVKLFHASAVWPEESWGIKVGDQADFMVLDMKPSIVTKDDLYTKARKVAPWVGMKMPKLLEIIDGIRIIKI